MEVPFGVPESFDAHIKLLFDLQVLAWQADITRVSTLLMAKELSGATFPNSTIRDAFHTLSHHSNQKENMDRFAVRKDGNNVVDALVIGILDEQAAAKPGKKS